MWRDIILKLDSSVTFYPGASDARLAALEKAMEVVIPTELKQLLMESR